MLLKKQIKRQKEYLSFQRRWNKLWEKMRDAPKRKLEVPYQAGWNIYVDVRDDIKNRADYPLIKSLIDNHTKPAHTDSVKLVRMCRRIKSWSAIKDDLWREARKRKLKGIPSLFEIKHYNKEFYDTLPLDIKKHFSMRKNIYYLGNDVNYSIYYVLDIPDYWIQLKVKPNMITHVRDLMPELISEMAELDKKMEYYRGKGWVPQGKNWNYGSSFPASNQRMDMRDQISKFLKGEIEDIDNLSVPREWDW